MLLKDLGSEIIFTNLQNFRYVESRHVKLIGFQDVTGCPIRELMQGADSTRFAACVRWKLCTVNVPNKTPLDAP